LQTPEKAPKHICEAIEGSNLEGSFGAPLDLALSQKTAFEHKTDKEREKAHKVHLLKFAGDVSDIVTEN
jgi:hypothetical protein